MTLAILWATWKRRRTPGSRPFAFLTLSVAWWLLGVTFEYSVNDLQVKMAWARLEYLGIVSLPVFWFNFTLEYSQFNRRLSSRLKQFIPYLWVIPAIALLLVFTNNELHNWIWTDIHWVGPNVVYEHGPAFYLLAAYGYLLLLIGTLFLIWMIARAPELYQNQAIMLIAGAIFPWLANFVYLTGIDPLKGADLTPFAFVITCILYTWAIFRFRLFDMVPVALDALVENIADGIAVFDEQHRLLYANPAAQCMLRLDAPAGPTAQQKNKNWIGQNADTLLAPWPEPLRCYHSGGQCQFELQSSPDITRHIDLRVDPLKTWVDSSAGSILLLHDITERKMSEERLHLQSVALESAGSAIVITNIAGLITWVNPAFTAITGYPPEEAIGQPAQMVRIHDQDFFKNFQENIQEGKIWQGEIINRRKDGSLYAEEQTIAPVRDKQGQITHFIIIKQDISERKRLKEMQDQLMYTIVHDLRNPLTSILAALDMLDYWNEMLKLPSEPREILQITRTSSWRMLGLVNTILDLAKLDEEGQLPLKLEPIALAPLAEQVCRVESPLATRRKVRLINNIPFDLPIIEADPIIIERILQNLVDNALKFTPDEGKVELSAAGSAQDREIVVCIQDNGPGIPVDVKDRLFQKFAAGNTKERGTGLGLAFCRIAVEAHGGKIWAENAGDTGSKFLFSLPVERLKDGK